jgi:hypothetical protein
MTNKDLSALFPNLESSTNVIPPDTPYPALQVIQQAIADLFAERGDDGLVFADRTELMKNVEGLYAVPENGDEARDENQRRKAFEMWIILAMYGQGDREEWYKAAIQTYETAIKPDDMVSDGYGVPN